METRRTQLYEDDTACGERDGGVALPLSGWAVTP